MRITYFTLTSQGATLARQLSEECLGRVVTKTDLDGQSFGQAVAEAWACSEALVFIMATGIVVRTIAPLLKSKTCDPAVVVMDARGNFAISLVSGHLGGANGLARQLAALAGGQAVITTGTDVENTLAFDVLAKENHLVIENIGELKYISTAMIEREPVDMYCPYPVLFELPKNIRHYMQAPVVRHTGGLTAADMAAEIKAAFGPSAVDVEACGDGQYATGPTAVAAVFIGRGYLAPHLEQFYESVLYLRPKNLCLGIGCKKNVSPEYMEEAFCAFQDLNRKYNAPLAGIATIGLKRQEPAILQLSKKYGLPLYIIDDQAIKQLEDQGAVTVSEFVRQTTGVGSVSEGCALALAGQLGSEGSAPVLLCPKTKYKGITFALAAFEIALHGQKG